MLDVINSRRSVRKWKSEAVAQAKIDAVMEAAMNAPSAGNSQDWDFLVLTGIALDAYLALNANAPKGAPAGILVCANLSRERYAGFHIHDCAAATQNILLALHSLGLGGVWTAVFPNAVSKIRTLLNIPEEVVPFAFVPFGVPAEESGKPQSRYDRGKVHYDSW